VCDFTIISVLIILKWTRLIAFFITLHHFK